MEQTVIQKKQTTKIAPNNSSKQKNIQKSAQKKSSTLNNSFIQELWIPSGCNKNSWWWREQLSCYLYSKFLSI